MIAYIKGTCLAMEEGRVVIDCHGIGYELQIGHPVKPAMIGQEIAYYSYMNVREDAIELYGFENIQEKNLFMHLKSVSGIGPKSAMNIIAADDSQTLALEIMRANESYLVTLPGVGKKTAGRIALELSDKLAASGEFDSLPQETKTPMASSSSSAVLEALAALGYQDQEIREVQKEVLDDYAEEGEDALLRAALRYLRRT